MSVENWPFRTKSGNKSVTATDTTVFNGHFTAAVDLGLA